MSNVENGYTPPFVRTAVNYDTRKASLKAQVMFKGKSRTQQNQLRDADINVIVDRILKTGQVPQMRQPLTLQNFNGIFDFRTAMDSVVAAQKKFMALPAKVRERFNNDPQRFVAFCEDPSNREEMKFLGLLKKEEPKAPAEEAKPQA